MFVCLKYFHYFSFCQDCRKNDQEDQNFAFLNTFETVQAKSKIINFFKQKHTSFDAELNSASNGAKDCGLTHQE